MTKRKDQSGTSEKGDESPEKKPRGMDANNTVSETAVSSSGLDKDRADASAGEVPSRANGHGSTSPTIVELSPSASTVLSIAVIKPTNVTFPCKACIFLYI